METKKKVIIVVVLLISIVICSAQYSKINDTANKHGEIVGSVMASLQAKSMDEKLIIDTKNEIIKNNKGNSDDIKIEELLKKIKTLNYRDDSRINEYIKIYEEVYNELDKIINIYEEDKETKYDEWVIENMVFLKGLRESLYSNMKIHNEEYLPEYREMIGEFPMNLVSKKNGWGKINEFKTVK